MHVILFSNRWDNFFRRGKIKFRAESIPGVEFAPLAPPPDCIHAYILC